MKEPKRLLSHGATDFERQLLRAVVSERPSALLRSRMQRGLGLVGPLAWASNVKAMFGTAASKVTGGVAVGLVVAGGFAAIQLFPSSSTPPTSTAPTAAPGIGVSALLAPTEEPRPSSGSDARRPQDLTANNLTASGPAAVGAPEHGIPEHGVSEHGATQPAGDAPSAALEAPASPDAQGDDGRLREEIALIDAARAALQRGDREQARASLSSYRERFPDGILSREANVLRRRADAK